MTRKTPRPSRQYQSATTTQHFLLSGGTFPSNLRMPNLGRSWKYWFTSIRIAFPYEVFEKGCIAKTTDGSPCIGLSYMADPVTFWTALQNLRGQSLIRTNPELKTISIHRSLQDRAPHHLCAEPCSRRRAFEESLFLLSSCQPEFPKVAHHRSPEPIPGRRDVLTSYQAN